MTKQELTQKVINAQAKVEKKQAIVQKHLDKLQKMVSMYADPYDIEEKREEIKEAKRKLADAKKTLESWQAKLDEKVSADSYLEANAPEVIKEFLEAWKQQAIEFYTGRFAAYVELKKSLREKELAARLEAFQTLPELARLRDIYKGRELAPMDLDNLWPSKPVEAFLHDRGLSYTQCSKKLAAAADEIILKMVYTKPEDRAAWLEKRMEEEKRQKLMDLVQRIVKVVGRITDASNLHIGKKGDINGIIIGTEGKAVIETIDAGGYNVQCYHFRTLIHEI